MHCRSIRLKRYQRILGISSWLVVLVPWSWCSLRAQTPIRIKMGTLAPRGSSLHQILLAMGEKWRQAPGGTVNLTVYTDGVMGGEADMVRKMRIGQIQSAMLTVVGLAEIDDSVTALQNMPMVFRDLEEVDFVRQKLRPMLERRFLEKGFVVLFWGDAGWVRFFSKQPMVHPADLKKMKIFVWSGDNHQVDIMKAAGYQPVPLETADIPTSLQTGLITVVPSVPFYALASQIYSSAPHMLELNWAPLVGGTVVTRKAWDSIPIASREFLLSAAEEAGLQIKARYRLDMEQSVESMKRRGLNVHSIDSQVEAEWRKTAEELYPKIRGGIVPADMFDQVQDLLERYRKSNPGSRK
jgi:TRAP-type C4-dicarboxylate transport system substrate-binding protein